MKHQVRTQPTEEKISLQGTADPNSKHVQIVDQTRLFRVSPSLGFKSARLETAQTPCAPVPLLHHPHGEKVSPCLQPKPLVFQLVPLPLALYSCMHCCERTSSPSPVPLVPGMLFGAHKLPALPAGTALAAQLLPPCQGTQPMTMPVTLH